MLIAKENIFGAKYTPLWACDAGIDNSARVQLDIIFDMHNFRVGMFADDNK